MLILRPVGRGNWKPLVLTVESGGEMLLPNHLVRGVEPVVHQRATSDWTLTIEGRHWRVSEVRL